jgi:hypothetical protein
LQGLLLGGVCEEAGNKAISHLLKGLMNLGFQLREGGGILSELVRPALLLGEELVVNVLKGHRRGRDIRARVRIETNLHGQSFQGEDLGLR